MDVTCNGPSVTFHFIDIFPRYTTVFDIDSIIECGDEQYRGDGSKLVTIDIESCFERFCSVASFEGDPLCM